MSRIPPHNILAEMSVLGAMFLGDGAANVARDILAAEEFYRDAHQHIFRAMCDLRAQDRPVDPVTLGEILTQRGIFEQVGGMGYLLQVGDSVFTTAHLRHYAAIVSEKAARRRLIEAATQVAVLAYDESDERPAAAVQSDAERLVFDCAANVRGSEGWEGRALIADSTERLDERYLAAKQSPDGKGILPGIETGFADLDEQLLGLKRETLTILAARPSDGKTSLAMTLCHNACKAGGRALVFSLEMSAKQLADRAVCAESRVNSKRYKRGAVSDEEFERIIEAQATLYDMTWHVFDESNLTAADIESRARRKKAEWGSLDIVMVDAIGLVKGDPYRRAENRNNEIGQIARDLKAMAKRLDCCCLCLCQLNRGVVRRDDKRPLLSDLRDSGEIEQEADEVLFIYRSSRYEPVPKEPRPESWCDETEIIIAKARDGEPGVVKLGFTPAYTRFDSWYEGGPF